MEWKRQQGGQWVAIEDLSRESLLKYAEKYGIKGRRTLSILGKSQQLVNAINSPVGLEFLRVLTARTESNRVQYDNLDIDSSNLKFAEARAKYKESESILFALLDVLENHDALLGQVKEELKK